MSKGLDPDETAHCVCKSPFVIAYSGERVNPRERNGESTSKRSFDVRREWKFYHIMLDFVKH